MLPIHWCSFGAKQPSDQVMVWRKPKHQQVSPCKLLSKPDTSRASERVWSAIVQGGALSPVMICTNAHKRKEHTIYIFQPEQLHILHHSETGHVSAQITLHVSWVVKLSKWLVYRLASGLQYFFTTCTSVQHRPLTHTVACKLPSYADVCTFLRIQDDKARLSVALQCDKTSPQALICLRLNVHPPKNM